jgi:tRNA-dependent cyclodipeptide synthase
MPLLQAATVADGRESKSYRAKPVGQHWRSFDRCWISVSVGQPYNEGAKLAALVEWVNRHSDNPFKHCDVLVADSLQRHNLHDDASDRALAHDRANRAGAAWIARNAETLGALQLPWRIVRWDEALAHPEYPAMRARLGRLSLRSSAVAAAIAHDSSRFVERAIARGTGAIDCEQALVASHEYLLEELAVDAILADERPAADLYPATSPHVYECLGGGGIPQTPRGLLFSRHRWIRIRLESRRGAPAEV